MNFETLKNHMNFTKKLIDLLLLLMIWITDRDWGYQYLMNIDYKWKFAQLRIYLNMKSIIQLLHATNSISDLRSIYIIIFCSVWVSISFLFVPFWSRVCILWANWIPFEGFCGRKGGETKHFPIKKNRECFQFGIAANHLAFLYYNCKPEIQIFHLKIITFVRSA